MMLTYTKSRRLMGLVAIMIVSATILNILVLANLRLGNVHHLRRELQGMTDMYLDYFNMTRPEQVHAVVHQLSAPHITSQSHDEYPYPLNLTVFIGQQKLVIVVDTAVIFQNRNDVQDLYLHVVVLNQATGSIMARESFDTLIQDQEDELWTFLNSITIGRILIFASKKVTFLHNSRSEKYIMSLGSFYVQAAFGDKWALILYKLGNVISEALGSKNSSHLQPLRVKTQLKLVKPPVACSMLGSRRSAFCQSFDGYQDVCQCDSVSLPEFHTHLQPVGNLLTRTSWLVMSDSSPRYLYSSLRSLAQLLDLQADVLSVHIMGFQDEPVRVAELYNLRVVQYPPMGEGQGSSSQFFKAALTSAFANISGTEFVIIMESGVKVSPQILRFLTSAIPRLRNESDLFCVSPYHPARPSRSIQQDTGELLRVDFMPGVIWVISRLLYIELWKDWPNGDKVSLYKWFNSADVRKDRKCLVPRDSLIEASGAQHDWKSFLREIVDT